MKRKDTCGVNRLAKKEEKNTWTTLINIKH